jgi:hypothetical protein
VADENRKNNDLKRAPKRPQQGERSGDESQGGDWLTDQVGDSPDQRESTPYRSGRDDRDAMARQSRR